MKAALKEGKAEYVDDGLGVWEEFEEVLKKGKY
jgi:hypothetical protein